MSPRARRPRPTRAPARQQPAARPSRRGRPLVRLRFGFVIIVMVLSVFGARLVQLQALDPDSYAEMAAAEGAVTVVLPAERGDIVDRNGLPLAESVAGLMVVADPQLTADRAPELATFLTEELGVDYFRTLIALRAKDRRFEYVARRVPATVATAVVDKAEAMGFEGLFTRRDPARSYPAGDIAANLVGFLGTDEALAGFERTFDTQLSGTDGTASYQTGGGNRIPLADSTLVEPVDGRDLRTTLDLDLQFYVQRVLRQTVVDAKAASGVAVVMDTRTGQVLALADYPTYDASSPLEALKADRGSRALSEPYEPGSVEKVLTMASLIDAGYAAPRDRFLVPGVLNRQDRPIHDWFDHGEIGLTLAGIVAKSSNIGTVLATDKMKAPQLVGYLNRFGLGRKTDVGVRGETAGILTPGTVMTPQTKDRVAFGQSLSVNALQMTAAINTIANGGLRVAPSLVLGSARTDSGLVVGTDRTTSRQVVSPEAARKTMLMMEKVVDPDDGVAPAAAIENYRVAGKTGTAQRVGPECGCYDGSLSVSFGGFAPADDARFTVYVVVHDPGVHGGGGSITGPAFQKIMSYTLRRYAVPPTGTTPPRLPVEWTPR